MGSRPHGLLPAPIYVMLSKFKVSVVTQSEATVNWWPVSYWHVVCYARLEHNQTVRYTNIWANQFEPDSWTRIKHHPCLLNHDLFFFVEIDIGFGPQAVERLGH